MNIYFSNISTVLDQGEKLYCIHPLMLLNGQMHHHDDLGAKCAYTCHLSNKTTRKSVLLSTPQIWLMKVSKKLA